MAVIVGVIETKALQWTKVSFDSVEPAGVCWCWYQSHAVALSVLNKSLLPVRREIVEYEVYSMRSRVALVETFPYLKDVLGRLALMDNSLQHIAMNIVESQELFGARFLGVGSTNSLGMTPPGPTQSGNWT